RLRSERTILSAPEPPDHDLVVGFCDADPCTVFDRSSIAVGASGFAGPFVATVPGTDRYTDDL
ncbi:MAG TPA: hypothetical protein VN636_11940, partial [Acidimicrobiia bacterium]|nr:hypothetical protein [Acidimicrobiia bacterium]